MKNVTFAIFGGRKVCDTNPLYQYDYGQVLQFKGLILPDAYEVHFGNSADNGSTTTQIGGSDGVEIPIRS